MTEESYIFERIREFLATEGIKMTSPQRTALFRFGDWYVIKKSWGCPKCGTRLRKGGVCEQHALPATPLP